MEKIFPTALYTRAKTLSEINSKINCYMKVEEIFNKCNNTPFKFPKGV